MTKISLDIFKNLPEQVLKKIKKISQPKFIKPMLATLTKNYFSSKDWIYEPKLDGVRCLAFKNNGKVSLLSRNNNNMNTEYPEIVLALEKQNTDNFIIDGEIVAIGKKGVSNFQLLQSRINLKKTDLIEEKQKNIIIKYYIFDLIYYTGNDLRNIPLIYRKKILKSIFKFNKILSYTPGKSSNGVKLFHQACKAHEEGLIAKQKYSTYLDKRSTNWLKFKCAFGQELVIGGYTNPEGSRSNFGALLVGYYKNNQLIYAGKVGTGFSHETLKFLGNKLKKINIRRCPFSNFDLSEKDINWVKPILVAEFEFANWTNSGKLRVGRFKGLREDKSAESVIKETPKSVVFRK